MKGKREERIHLFDVQQKQSCSFRVAHYCLKLARVSMLPDTGLRFWNGEKVKMEGRKTERGKQRENKTVGEKSDCDC